MVAILLTYAALGCLTGIMSGLLGLGGGIVMVPALLYTLPLFGITEQTHYLALGTSMAAIIFTSVSSARAHHKRGSVLWGVVARFAPGIIAGVFLGGAVAVHMPVTVLQGVFSLFLLYVGVQMFMDIKPKASRQLPAAPGLAAVGGAVGLLSSFLGIGGSMQAIAFLTFCNVPMRQAIGTSAGVGVPIAVFGALSYIGNGWSAEHLPSWSLGYVYLPALPGLAAASMCAAPLGARLAYRLPVPRLKRIFALFVFFVAGNMIWKTFW